MIYAGSRFRSTDSALLMEKVVEDLGEVIKDAKNRLGYSKVVLAGWSGGGSLSLYYQQQAGRSGLITPTGIMLLANPYQPPRHTHRVARCVRPR